MNTHTRLFSVLPAATIVGIAVTAASAVEWNRPRPEHGLHYTTPATTWDEALPLGNGILGALVWGDGNPVNISLDRTDLWDLRPVPEFHSDEYKYKTMLQWHKEGRAEDLIRLYEEPYSRSESPTKIPAGRIEMTLEDRPAFAAADLDIREAVGSIAWADGSRLQVMLHATEPVGLITATIPGKISFKLVAPPFGKDGKGGLAKLGYPAPARLSGETWQAFSQEGYGGFRFAVYLAWKHRSGHLLAAWSVASSFEGSEPLRIAQDRVEVSLRDGFEKSLLEHATWWDRYWRQSSVNVPNKTIERQWYLEQYKFGSASRRGSPPITLQGPWTADNGDLPPWKGDYHHDLNTQLSYWPCYSGNHLDEGLSFLDWLWNTRSNCVDWTKRFFDLPGMNVPMTADLNNNQMGGWRQYTHSATTAAWLAHHFYLHWRYSADRDFLRDRAYPYLRDAATFIEAVSAAKDSDGKRALALSASPEINDNKPSAWFTSLTNYDLALMRWLLGAAAELADELRETGDAKRWRAALAEMPDYARGDDGRLLIAKDYPLSMSHRHFSHLMAIHPLSMINWDVGEDARSTIRACIDDLQRLGSDWWCGYSFAWLANLAARARDGKLAEQSLETFATAFCLRNSFHCNGDQSGRGYSKFKYRPFTLEGNFAAAAGLQEMLLQSHGGTIRVFPAIPEAWKEVSFNTLRTEGAFLISAQRVNGMTKAVEIVSERGGPCRLISPFSGKVLTLDFEPGNKKVLTQDP